MALTSAPYRLAEPVSPCSARGYVEALAVTDRSRSINAGLAHSRALSKRMERSGAQAVRSLREAGVGCEPSKRVVRGRVPTRSLSPPRTSP